MDKKEVRSKTEGQDGGRAETPNTVTVTRATDTVYVLPTMQPVWLTLADTEVQQLL